MSKKHTYLTDNGLKSIEPKDILKEGYDKFYFIHHPYRYFKDVVYRYFKYKRKEKQKGFNPVNTWDLSSYFWHYLFEMIEAYLDNASEIIDLDYHKFTYEGKEYTQNEVLKILKDEIKDIISLETGDTYDMYIYEKIRDKEKKALDLWYLVLPVMGW